MVLTTYKHKPSKQPREPREPRWKLPKWVTPEFIGTVGICLLLLGVSFMAYLRGEHIAYLEGVVAERGQAADELAMALGEREGEIDTLTAELKIRQAEIATLTAQVASLTAQVETLTIAVEAARRSQVTTPPRTSQATPARAGQARNTTGVEQWRSLVAKYFDAQHVDDALSVMRQESGGNPNAEGPILRGGYRCEGLFQQHSRYWAARAARAGVPGASPFDPEANVRVSAMLSRRGADWSHWCAQPE